MKSVEEKKLVNGEYNNKWRVSLYIRTHPFSSISVPVVKREEEEEEEEDEEEETWNGYFMSFLFFNYHATIEYILGRI